MPSYWYSIRDNIIRDEDDTDEIDKKIFNRQIVAANKPYFMIYVYPALRSKNLTYTENRDFGAAMRFYAKGIQRYDDLSVHKKKSKQIADYLHNNQSEKVGNNPCTVNRICWLFEKTLSKTAHLNYQKPFDYTIMKCNVEYSQNTYEKIKLLYKSYQHSLRDYQKDESSGKTDFNENKQAKMTLIEKFKMDCEIECCNEEELCDILLDLCYHSTLGKQFVWDICGDRIISNLLRNANGSISYPSEVESDGEFEYCGRQFVMCRKEVSGDSI